MCDGVTLSGMVCFEESYEGVHCYIMYVGAQIVEILVGAIGEQVEPCVI